MAAVLNNLVAGWGHIVAEVVKAELGAGCVDDVAGVSIPAVIDLAGELEAVIQAIFLRICVCWVIDKGAAALAGFWRVSLEDANGHAEAIVERSHPDRVTLYKVVVCSDKVDTFASDRVEVRPKRGCKGFSFAGTQLGDSSIVLHHATDKLDIEVAHFEVAPGCFTAGGEGFWEDVIEGLVVGLCHFLAGLVLGFIPDNLADTGPEFIRLTF